MSLFSLEEQIKKVEGEIKERSSKIVELRKLCRKRPLPEGMGYGKELYIQVKELQKLKDEYSELYKKYLLEKRQGEELPPPMRVHLEGRQLVVDHDDQE